MPSAFAIHAEGDFRAMEVFLSRFLPDAGRVLGRHLGRDADGEVHVILSSTGAHEARFPPRSKELLELLDVGTAEELAGGQDDLGQRAQENFPRWLYGHGVATRVQPAHAAPRAAAVGALAIYLDVETIEALANRLGVSLEGMLATVAVHELSHIVRGHADDGERATHGWLKEGDAQRDAWHVLTEMLSDDRWRTPARFGRIAQVRASAEQPPAYRQFAVSSAERLSLARHQPVGATRCWAIRPQREVWRMMHEGFVETPLAISRRMPAAGDRVYLHDMNLVAGPWFVTAVTPEPLTAHPLDLRAVQRMERAHTYGTPPAFVWLQLRAANTLKAGKARDADLFSPELSAYELSSAKDVEPRLTEDAEKLVRQGASDALSNHKRDWEQIGRPPPDLDPFDDWPTREGARS